MSRWMGEDKNTKKNEINNGYNKEKSNESANKILSESPKQQPLPIILLIIGLIGIVTIVVVLVFYSGKILDDNSINEEREEELEIEINENEIVNNTDTEPPKLISIDVKPVKINVSGYLTITAVIKDNNSGVDAVISSVKNPIRIESKDTKGLELSVHLRETDNSEIWCNDLYIPDYYESGEWVISSIYTTDVAGNSNYYYINSFIESNNYFYDEGDEYIDTKISIENFNVENTTPDRNVPVFNFLKFTPDVINDEGEFLIQAKGSDSPAGISFFSIKLNSPSAMVKSENSGNSFNIYLSYNSDSDLWETKFNVYSYYESGIWTVKSIRLLDKAGNVYLIEYDSSVNTEFYVFDNGRITDIQIIRVGIITNGEDNIQPEIKRIKAVDNYIKDSGVIKIQASIGDVGSGVGSGSVTAYSPSKLKEPHGGDVDINESLYYNSDTEYWEATISLESFHEKGKWKIGHIYIKDNANNPIHYIIDDKLSKNFYVYKDNNTNKYKISNISIIEFNKD